MNNRGVAWLPAILAVALIGAVAAPWLRVHLFEKKPPVSQLSQAQADLQAAQAKAAAAEAALAQAKADDTAKQLAEARTMQQMVAGAALSNARAPVTPETQLTGELLVRAELAGSKAFGDLPDAQKQEIAAIVAGALSKVQAERDEARARLALSDQKLAATAEERDAIKAALPAIQAAKDAAEKKAETAQALVTAKTEEVKQWAVAKEQADKNAVGLAGLVSTFERWAVIIGILYIFIHWALPSLAQQFPAFALLQKGYQAVASVASAHLIQPVQPPKP